MKTEEKEWQLVSIRDFYKKWLNYNTGREAEAFGVYHKCQYNEKIKHSKEHTSFNLYITAYDGKCYSCGKEVPDYIYFQWKLLNE